MSYLTNETKNILNKLRCPVCQNQIDIIYIGSRKGFNFGCSEDLSHYSLILDQKVNPPQIIQEQVHIYDGNKKYQLNKLYYENDIFTEIVIYKIDPEGRELFAFEHKRLLLENNLFDFSNFHVDKAIQRIKTILVFH